MKKEHSRETTEETACHEPPDSHSSLGLLIEPTVFFSWIFIFNVLLDLYLKIALNFLKEDE
jgi:hypothetical protein